jgi:CMP-N,N'-diacetyllegionaminic acid synthase
MINGKTFLALIPARGGSKRLPHKNLLDLAGKPLIAWTIEAGLNNKYIDEIVVASDNRKILEIAKQYGANDISLPENLANDAATIYDAISYVIENTKRYDYIVLLQPTSPLRTEKHIDEAIEFLVHRKADAVVSVCEAEHNPLWTNILPGDFSMEKFLRSDVVNKKSQELPTFYRLNGAIYICDSEIFAKQKTFFIQNNIFAYRMDRESSVDIDEGVDLKLASLLKRSIL